MYLSDVLLTVDGFRFTAASGIVFWGCLWVLGSMITEYSYFWGDFHLWSVDYLSTPFGMSLIEEAWNFSMAENIKWGNNMFCLAISNLSSGLMLSWINILDAEIIEQNDIPVIYDLMERNKSERNDMFWFWLDRMELAPQITLPNQSDPLDLDWPIRCCSQLVSDMIWHITRNTWTASAVCDHWI